MGPRTPVLVGAAAVLQREEDPNQAREPALLMTEALSRAADDAGARDLLARADSILVPRGFWDYPDPGRLVAERLGAAHIRSVFAEIGILQTTLFGWAGRAIQAGEADVVLVAGGEAKYRSQCAERAGVDVSTLEQSGAKPDQVLQPAADIMHALEIQHGLTMPVSQYAVMENALRKAQGLSVAEHRREVAEMWSAFSEVAETNRDAWRPERVPARLIAEPVEGNRMLAFPYTKLHNSQWNVDQAAGLVFCSVEAALAAGVPEERWVYLRAVTESNHMLPLVRRAQPHRAPAAQLAGRRAHEIAGIEVGETRHRELYSCFPSAVRIQARELGLPTQPAPTVTGGMAFAGGPLNNFVLQAAVRMAQVLRGDRGSHGLVTAVSGILTKIGVSLWSTAPGDGGFGFADVATEVERQTPVVDVVDAHRGPARISGYTVLYGREGPSRGVALCDLPGGARTLAVTTDADLVEAMTREEFCGRTVRVDGEVLHGD